MRKLLCILALLLCSCAKQTPIIEEEITTLPVKENPNSTLMSDSPISASNIEDYLFLENTVYIDTREVNQFNEEGHIAGFVNIPFYEAIAGVNKNEGILFNMTKPKDENGNYIANLGDVNSFIANYEEASQMMKFLFPEDKNIVIISTAGVEATYLMNLLIQIGYDGSKLYNAGCYSNGIGNAQAYRLLENTKYKVNGQNIYTIDYTINWGELTPINK